MVLNFCLEKEKLNGMRKVMFFSSGFCSCTIWIDLAVENFLSLEEAFWLCPNSSKTTLSGVKTTDLLGNPKKFRNLRIIESKSVRNCYSYQRDVLQKTSGF